MKKYIIAFILGIAFMVSAFVSYRIGYFRGRGDVVIPSADTLYVYRTKNVYTPVFSYSSHMVPLFFPLKDTTGTAGDVPHVQGDSIVVPIEQRVYEDSTYRAVVSGFRPSLDTLQLRIPEKIVTNYVTVPQVRKQRVTFGVSAGFGAYYGVISRRLDCGPGVQIGVSINF